MKIAVVVRCVVFGGLTKIVVVRFVKTLKVLKRARN